MNPLLSPAPGQSESSNVRPVASPAAGFESNTVSSHACPSHCGPTSVWNTAWHGRSARPSLIRSLALHTVIKPC